MTSKEEIMINIKKVIKKTAGKVHRIVETNGEILKCDFQYSPHVYSTVYAGLVAIGFTTGILVGNAINKNKEIS